MPIHQAFLAFNSGEISPYLFYRSDFAKVPAAAAKMRNFLPMPFGSVSKRPGTRWRAATLSAGANSRAFPFVSSDGVEYILHFTQGQLKIYRKNGTTAATLAFVTGYTFPSDSTQEFSLRGLQVEQVNDVAFVTHPRIHPLQLVTTGDTAWSIGFAPFERAPMLDENADRTKTYTVASNPVAATWAHGASYAAGAKAFTNSEWQCIAGHSATWANYPGGGGDWKNYWRRMFYPAGSAITLLGDDRSELAWVGQTYDSYVAGQTALGVGGARPFGLADAFYVCVVNHTLDATYSNLDNHAESWDDPLATGQTWVWVYPYSNALSSGGVFVGDTHYSGGNIYRCILAHGASGGGPGLYQPGVTSGWASYWELKFTAYAAPVTLALPTSYVSGTRVSYNGLIYSCNTTHVPTNANRPGVGAVWTLLSGGWTSSFASSPTSPGKYYKIAPRRDAADFQVELTAVAGNNGQYSAQIVVEGGWNFFTFGTWSGTFVIERSINGGVSWEVVRSYQSSADRNVADKGTEDEPTLLRIYYGHTATGANNPRALLVPERDHVTGYCLMNVYVGTAMMTGHAKTSMLSGNTYEWTEGAFDLERGFPRAIALHGSRLWFAGTVANPVSIWGSRISDFFDFDAGTLDDDGIFRTLASSNHQPIRWLASTRRLFVGTSVGEWVEGSETSDTPITPTNAQFRQYTPTGSCPHQPLPVNDGLFFLGRQGGRLYELGANDAGNATYAANDLTRLAEHLTASGISNMAFQQTREPCLWAVTRSGALLSYNYSKTENISSWAMHTTQNGLFRDVIIFPSDEGDDEVFFIIDRGSTSNLERFDQNWQATQEAGTLGNYVDAAGMTGGNFPILSELQTPPQDMNIDGGGTQGRRKRANEILLNVYQSFGGGIGYDGQTVLFDWSQSSDPMDLPNTLKTKWIGVTTPPAHMDDLQFSIVHSDPYPFTVRAGVLRWSLHEP